MEFILLTGVKMCFPCREQFAVTQPTATDNYYKSVFGLRWLRFKIVHKYRLRLCFMWIGGGGGKQ